jgi:hypothetical protein
VKLANIIARHEGISLDYNNANIGDTLTSFNFRHTLGKNSFLKTSMTQIAASD